MISAVRCGGQVTEVLFRQSVLVELIGYPCSAPVRTAELHVNHGDDMGAKLDIVSEGLSGLLASVWSQLRVSASVGFGPEVGPEVGDGQISGDDPSQSSRTIRSMDDYAGYHTSNGLGSLDIGGGRSRWGE
jgi:hypothetical protein